MKRYEQNSVGARFSLAISSDDHLRRLHDHETHGDDRRNPLVTSSCKPATPESYRETTGKGRQARRVPDRQAAFSINARGRSRQRAGTLLDNGEEDRRSGRETVDVRWMSLEENVASPREIALMWRRNSREKHESRPEPPPSRFVPVLARSPAGGQGGTRRLLRLARLAGVYHTGPSSFTTPM